MFKRLIILSCVLLLFSITSTSRADLAAYYSMDEGSGDFVADGSGNGHDGKIDGTPTWVPGKSETAIEFGVNASNGLYCDAFDTTAGTQKFTAAMWIKFTVNANGDQYQGIIANRNGNDDQYWGLEINRGDGSYYFGAAGDGGATQYGLGTLTADEWVHLAITFDGTTVVSYINGVQNNTSTTPRYGSNPMSLLRIGSSDAGANTLEGSIDEVYIYSGEIFTQEQIVSVMNGEKKPSTSTAGLAKKPYPGNNGSDVSIDVGMLSWKSGDYVETDGGTHDLFLGKDKASVAAATVADPMGTMVFAGLDVNSVSIARLDYDAVYYWRVDEVNLPANAGTSVGKVWSFSTEAEGIDLTFDNIIDVTADTPTLFYVTQEPNMTCNESGLDANDLHSSFVDNTMWLGIGDTYGDTWIQYEFDQIYKFHEILVWNYNEPDPGQYFGAKDVNITYSEDGLVWKALDDLVELNIADGADGYAANTIVELNGAIAKYIKITFYDSWMDGIIGGGLSEVRFSVIPTRAMEPDPEDEAEDIELNQVLSWKKGRDVVSHTIYIGSDVNDVKAGIADVIADTDEAMYSPVLELAKTYYWRVDEVNDNEAYKTWDGPVWSFSTVESILIDGFEEGYDDTDANAVYMTWIDGYDNETVNGSIMGNLTTPHLSDTRHSGSFAAPMYYNNTVADYSEVVAETANLPIATSDWTVGSPATLTIWFYGDANNVVGDSEMYCKIGGKTATYSGTMDVLTREKWYQWDIDLAALNVNLSNIPNITIGIKNAGSEAGSGVILLDDIMLTGLEAQAVGDSVYFEAEGNMTLTGLWRDNQAATAGYSGSGYIDTANTGSIATEPNMASLATKAFTIATGGEYIVNIRYRPAFSGGWRNAIFVRIINGSGNPAATDVTLQTANGWVNCDELAFINPYGWDQIYNRNASNQNEDVTWTLPAGNYTIQFSHKEPGVKIDTVEIVQVVE